MTYDGCNSLCRYTGCSDHLALYVQQPLWLPTDKKSTFTSALLLHQPPATAVFSSRAFLVAAPTVWNSLHINTRSADTLLTFRSRLKTELFLASYDTWLFGMIPSLPPDSLATVHILYYITLCYSCWVWPLHIQRKPVACESFGCGRQIHNRNCWSLSLLNKSLLKRGDEIWWIGLFSLAARSWINKVYWKFSSV